MEEENKQPKISYLFYPNYQYTVYAQENTKTGKMFYKIKLPEMKGADGQNHKGYMQVYYAGCTPPDNGAIIKILNAKEGWYSKDRYTVITYLTIFNYELVKSDFGYTDKAIRDYNNIPADEDDLPF